MEGDTFAASLGVVALGQRPVPTALALANAGDTAVVERPQSEGTVSLGTSVEPPRALMRLGTSLPWLKWADPQNLGATSFVLDDPAEERELVGYNRVLGGVARLMHTTLISMNDGLA